MVARLVEGADQSGQMIPLIAAWAGSHSHGTPMSCGPARCWCSEPRTRCLFPAKPRPGAFVGNVQ
jgi:hypothetical protein